MERTVREEEVFAHSVLEAGGTTHCAGPHGEHQGGEAGPGEQFRLGYFE